MCFVTLIPKGPKSHHAIFWKSFSSLTIYFYRYYALHIGQLGGSSLTKYPQEKMRSVVLPLGILVTKYIFFKFYLKLLARRIALLSIKN